MKHDNGLKWISGSRRHMTPEEAMNREMKRQAAVQKELAWQVFMQAKKRKLIIKATHCESCGNTGMPLQAHHEDSLKPLDVRWLCKACHVVTHRKAAGK